MRAPDLEARPPDLGREGGAEGADAAATGAGVGAGDPRPGEPGNAADAGELLARLRQLVAHRRGLRPEAVPTNLPLISLGLDSLALIELLHDVEGWGRGVPPFDALLDEGSLESLAAALAGQPATAGGPAAGEAAMNEQTTREADMSRPAAREAAMSAPATGDLPATAGGVEAMRGAAAGAPLSHGQRAIWFLERLAPGSGAYHIVATAEVTGAIDRGAFTRAWQTLARRHAALRTLIVSVAGEPRRQVLDQLEPEIRWLDEQQDGAADRRGHDGAISSDRHRAPAAATAGGAEPGTANAFSAAGGGEPGASDAFDTPGIPGASGVPGASRDRRLRDEACRPFDLAHGPLVRLAVLGSGTAGAAIALTLHHVAADFWSLAILVRELGLLYRQEAGGAPAALAPLAADYGDFVRWQEEWLAGAAGRAALAYWLEALQGAPRLELPTDRPRPSVQGHRGRVARRRLGRDETAALEALATRSGATLFMALLAGFETLLHRYGAGDDLVVGCPSAGRRLAAFAPLVGYFVNPLPLRTSLAGAPGFAALLGRVRRAALGGFAHQDLPFPLLVERLQGERDPSRSPLFQVMLVLHRAERREDQALAAFALGEAGGRLDAAGLALTSLAREPLAAQFDLTLTAAADDGALRLCLEYNADLFESVTATRLLRHLQGLLRQAVAAPAVAVGELPLLTAAERTQTLQEWNDTAVELPPPACLHEMFTAQARLTPDAPAVLAGVALVAGVAGVAGIAGEERLSYADLDRRANQLAHRLRGLGVGAEVRVGLGLQRTADLVIGVLGVWKAGGAYVPLDPAYPRERLAFMLADGGAKVLVTTEPMLAGVAGGAGFGGFSGAVVCVDRERQELARLPGTAPQAAVTPDNLAYAIYTSGSTGRPKAVAITHRSAAVLAHWARAAFSPAELAGVLASTSICFDLSVFELLAPLCWGGTVILAENAFSLARLPAAARVTLINTVPSVLGELLRQQGLPAAVRTVCLAGEPLPAALARQLEATGTVHRLLNLYGPSEDTTYSTWKAVGAGEEPTLGRPLWRTRAHVLDRQLAPVPVGVIGELFLGGGGLARGYLGRPEQTAERFLPDPWGGAAGEPGARLYRTGDLVRRRCDGELEYLGRADDQVKIRGHRIELGEVEAALLHHPRVSQAAALVRRDGPQGEPRLIAYVAAAAAPRELRSELLAQLRAALPAPMVPAAFVVLERLPLTPSGKIDRRALPAPGHADRQRGGAARTAAEQLLAEILADALGVDTIGAGDDFFALGGHSLLALRALARIERSFGVSLPLSAVFQHPTVAGLAERIAAAAGDRGAELPPLPSLPSLAPLSRDAPLPLSFAQQRLWFLHQLDPESPAYHIAGVVRLCGRLAPSALAAALGELLARHEALRTSFPAVGGEPAQAISPPAGQPRLPCLDLAGLPPARRAAAARTNAAHCSRRPFDLARGPLLRLLLVRLAPREHWLVTVFHHIVADGASVEIFVRELAALYAASAGGAPLPLPQLPVQYADFAAWQRQALTPAALAAPLGWWRHQLAGLPVVELPADRPRRPGGSDRGGSHAFALTTELPAADLRAACRAAGVTPYMALLGAFLGLVARLTGRTDLVVGSPLAGRGRIETEGLIGLFVNTLALRVTLDGDPGGGELLAQVRRAVLAAHAHGEVPFERVVEELQPERRGDQSSLFQIMFTHLQTGVEDLETAGLNLHFMEVDTGTAKFELSLWLRDEGAGPTAKLVYRRDLFDAATVIRLAGHYRSLLAGLVRQPELPLSRLPLLAPGERHQLIREWNATATALPAAVLHELFEARAAAAPAAAAVLAAAGTGSWSFGGLNRRANRLARRLRQLGVGPEAVVGVCADRSPEMIAAVLGVWKAGGAYLPLDPEYPAERLRFVLQDAGATVLVTRPGLLPAAAEPAPAVVDMAELAAPGDETEDANLGVPVACDNLAYVIYTSGSTGRPKGVMIRHGAVVNLLAALRQVCYGSVRPLRVGVNASLAFDAAVKQLVQLLAGHALCLVPEEVRRDGVLLGRFLAEQRLDALDCTPSQLRLALDSALSHAGAPATVLVGGEAIGDELWRAAANGAQQLWNVYGPTECTVDATAARMAGERPALGRPLANVRVHLLDAALEPVPIGVHGEIWIGGAGLARGYWRRPDLTALAFRPDPFAAAPGERLYRSGDLGRRLADGSLEFIGRADQQVKLRGFRVELGEIEARLGLHPAIAAAAVACAPDGMGEPRLAAYYVPVAGAAPAEAATPAAAAAPADAARPAAAAVSAPLPALPELEEELRSWLRRELPEPMVPTAFVCLAELPLTPNGKLDRHALPVPLPASQAGGYVAPRTAVERQLAELWAGLLQRERVGVHDSFFDLGGHSLLAAQMMSRVRQLAGVEVPLRQLFEAPTVEALAAAIEERPRATPGGEAPAGGAAAIQARRRGRRDLAQLVGDLKQLSPEEAGRRLHDRGAPPPPRRSS